MSSQRARRAKTREAQTKPINFTCGLCGKVHKFVEGYVCFDEITDEKVEEVN